MPTMVRGAIGAVVALGAAGAVTWWLAAQPATLDAGPPPMVWAECQPEQVEVMILGTFHFAQQDEVDILSPERQEELARIAERLERFAPDRVAVEFPYARAEELDAPYRRYLETDSLASRNEIAQIGFRLARRLGHERVYAVDVRMTLWHDSIRVFDERYPGARARLRRRWNVRYPSAGARGVTDAERPTEPPLLELLLPSNGNAPPVNEELARFLPLVEGDVYAGALKLRPWYDRNLRIVQNMFRILEEDDRRVFLVIGGGHVRVLRQILAMTPQLCAVDPLAYLDDAPAGS